MYNYIAGKVAAKYPDCVVLDIQGIGYELFVSFKTYQKVPDCGQFINLYVHVHYREDMQKLFGFATESEKDLFRLMIVISGIGPKVALAALSTMGVEELEQIVTHQDVIALTRVPGIGKKVAERLLMELKDKMHVLPLVKGGSESVSLTQIQEDVVMALMSLGYKEPQARKTLSQLQKDPGTHNWDFQDLMKECLALV